MTKRHQSFLLRCWRLGECEQRIEIEHIQSGQKRLARSVEEAVAWVCEADHATAEPVVEQEDESAGSREQSEHSDESGSNA